MLGVGRERLEGVKDTARVTIAAVRSLFWGGGEGEQMTTVGCFYSQSHLLVDRKVILLVIIVISERVGSSSSFPLYFKCSDLKDASPIASLDCVSHPKDIPIWGGCFTWIH